MSEMQESGVCAICAKRYTRFGNNPEPLLEFEKRVCDQCNSMFECFLVKLHPQPSWDDKLVLANGDGKK